MRKCTRSLFALTFAVVFLVSVAALAAETTADAAGVAGEAASLPAVAVAFVHSLAKSDFQGAETAFDEQMKAAVTPEKLQTLWQGLIQQVGAYQSVNGSKTVVVHGYTTVIVETKFKLSAVGVAVTFDASHKIAGLHFVPPS